MLNTGFSRDRIKNPGKVTSSHVLLNMKCPFFSTDMIEKADSETTVTRPGAKNRKSVIVVDDTQNTQQSGGGGCCGGSSS